MLDLSLFHGFWALLLLPNRTRHCFFPTAKPNGWETSHLDYTSFFLLRNGIIPNDSFILYDMSHWLADVIHLREGRWWWGIGIVVRVRTSSSSEKRMWIMKKWHPIESEWSLLSETMNQCVEELGYSEYYEQSASRSNVVTDHSPPLVRAQKAAKLLLGYRGRKPDSYPTSQIHTWRARLQCDCTSHQIGR